MPIPDQLRLAWARPQLSLGAEGAESGMGVLSAGFVPGAAGDGIDIPEAEALELLLDLFPVPDCLCEKDCFAAVKMRPELFVAQRFGVIVLLRTHYGTYIRAGARWQVGGGGAEEAQGL